MDQYIGKLLDNRYEILECIGTGGMAVVYKARCHRLNRLVAVKILKPELAQDAEFRRRFHDESQAVAMLSHPNIVAVYDVSHSDDLDYIVMELMNGITLKQYMQKKGLPLNWREALHFITQIMKALSHAHSRGIIHRDIKPHNIMVLRDGSVKVADFGIARLASAAQSTLTQETLGSVHYISPEQARGSHVDSRSDIYSAGVVLYEMTAGRLPYEGDTPVSVAIQHISSIPLPPRDINPDIPEALEAITMKAMASDVEKRYVSAEAMLADLEEFRKNPSINFEYTQEDLFQGGVTDEPTLVRTLEDSGSLRRRRSYEEEDELEYDSRRDRGGGIWPTVLAVGAILIFIGGVIYFLWNTVFGSILADTVTELEVPNLLGMTIEEVNQDLAQGKIDRAFVIVEGRTVTSDLPAGQIISQDPSPKEKKKGEPITITVDISAGAEQLVMPNVVNTDWRQAVSLLRDQMGLDTSWEYENSNVTINYVIRSDPEADSPLEPGQEVKLVISLGPEIKNVTVPDFKTQTIEWARQEAEKMKLVVGNVEEEENDSPKGTVIYQSIAPTSEVPEGTEIRFRVSSGPPETSEPPVDTTTEPPNATTEPPVTSSEPSATPSDTPAPSTQPSDQPVIATTKTVFVNLSDYTGQIRVRIEVGGKEQCNSPMESALGTVSQTITGTGQQTVNVYIDDVLVDSYTVDFDQ